MSAAGGFAEALNRVKAIGGNCLQLFSANPRGWKLAKISGTEAEEFRKQKKELGIDPVYFHASYLINLASDGEIGDLSEKSLIAELDVAKEVGVKGSIIHLGSFKDAVGQVLERQRESLIGRIKSVLDKTPPETLFIIENAGTRKIGQTIEEIAGIVKEVRSKRVRVCLDTCHLHAGGYDLRADEKLDIFLEKVDSLFGFDRVELFHLNDSRDPFGSLRDRHENIGEGEVGRKVFELLLKNKKTGGLPFIIETPGFDDDGPDKKNLDILKQMVC